MGNTELPPIESQEPQQAAPRSDLVQVPQGPSVARSPEPPTSPFTPPSTRELQPGEFMAIQRRRDKELQDRQFMAYLQDQMQRDPDLEAEVRKLSIDIGLDREVVRNNIDRARQLFMARQVQMRNLAETSPVLRVALDHPEFASIAHDDLDNLAWYERAAKNYEAGQLEVERGRIGTRLMRDPEAATDYDLRRIVEIERQLETLPTGDSVIGMTSRVIGQMSETAPTTIMASAGVSLFAGALTGGTAAAPAGLLTAGLVGGYQAYEIEAGNAYRDYVLGGMERSEAIARASAVGWVNALIEAGSLGVVGRPFTSAGRKVMQRMAKERLLQPITERSLLRTAGQWGLNIGAETGTEALQEVVTAIGEKMGMDRTRELRAAQIGEQVGEFQMPGGGAVRTLEDGTVQVTPDVFYRVTGKRAKGEFVSMKGDVADRFVDDLEEIYPLESVLSDDEFMSDVVALAFETAGYAVKGMFLPTLPGPLLDYAASRKRVAQAKAAGEAAAEMIEKAKESKLNKRNSAAFALHLRRVLQGKPLENVYIDRDQLKEALSAASIDLDDLNATLPGVAEQLRQPAAEQPDVVIDGGTFIAKMSDSPLLEVLRPIVRADKDAYSLTEAKQKESQTTRQAAELQQRLESDATARAVWDNSLDQLEETSYRQQVDAGTQAPIARANAQLHRAAVDAMARRYGIDPGEFLRSPNLRVDTGQMDQQAAAPLNRREDVASDSPAWFHGTPTGGFSRFDVSRLGSAGGTSRGVRNEPGRALLVELEDTGERIAYVADPDAIRFRDGRDQAWRPDEGNSLQATGEDGEVVGQFDSQRMRILLGKKHNATTWLHEFSHYWFELQLRMARAGKAPDAIIADLDAIARWAGMQDAYDLINADPDTWRTVHESWAYNVERYVFENVAPSVELRGVFRRMVRWMVQAYHDVVGRINASYRLETGKNLPALNAEVRAVMGRMLATDEQIEARLQEDAIASIFEGDESLTAEQSEMIGRYVSDVEGEAREELMAVYMRELQYLRSFRSRTLKDMQKKARAMRKAAEEQERADLLASSNVARLQHWLKTGEELGQDGQPDPSGLLGAEPKVADDDRRWGRGKRDPEGVDPELLVEVFGFDSVETMLAELDQAVSLDEEVLNRTDERMMRDHSELADEESMRNVVDAAVNNRALLKLRAAEAKIIDKSLPEQGRLIAAAREVARRIVGQLSVADLTNTDTNSLASMGTTGGVELLRAPRVRLSKPRSYALAAARAERAALIARGAGDFDEMRRQQMTAIQQRALAQEAYARKDALERGLTAMQKRVRHGGSEREKQVARTYNGAAVDTVREILANFKLHAGATNRRDVGYVPWRQLGDEDPLRAELELAYDFATEKGTDWADLTIAEAEAVIDSMQGVLEQGRQSQLFELEGFDTRIEQLVDYLTQQAEDQGRAPRPRQQGGKLSQMWRKLGSINATWQRIQPLLEALDGGEAGTLTRAIWQPTVERTLAMRKQEAQVLEQLREALAPLREQMRQDSKMTREIAAKHLIEPTHNKPYVFRQGKLGIIGALLHSGNDSNLRRLLGGYGWGDVNPETLEVDRRAWDRQVREWEADGTVTEDDWKVVRAIWSIYDRMLPQTQAAHVEVLGFEMKTVERGTVQTRWGTFQGGYVPAAPDTSLTPRAKDQKVDETLEWQRSIPAVARGHTKDRVEGDYRALDLDPLNQALHFHKSLVFSHMGPQVRRLNRILQRREVRAALERLEPDIYDNYLNHWMQTVATQSTTLSQEGDPFAGMTLLRTLRRTAGTAAMLGNVLNSIQGISGAVLAAVKVKPRYMLLAIRDLASSSETRRMLREATPYMEDRHQPGNSVYEVRDKIYELQESSNGLMGSYQRMQKFLNRNTYFMQEWVQKPLDRIVWLGAYKQELAKSGLEDRARAAGDAAVMQTQADTLAISLARGEKGSDFVKLFTQFNSWFIMMGSLRAQAVRDPGNFTLVAGAVFPMVLTLVIGEVVAEMVRGTDDDEDWDTTATRMAAHTFLSLPRAVGPIGSAASAVVATLLNAEAYHQRMPSPPALSSMMRAAREAKQLMNGDGLELGDVFDFGEAASALLGAPVQVITRRARAGFDVLGEGDGEFSARGLVTGRR